MITLEGYEIEEMKSINHIMTVELQFKTPVTQKEDQDYLSRVLTKANELEAQNEKEICKKIFNADGIISKSTLAAAFGVPESELNIDARETYPAADTDSINTTAKRILEETANAKPKRIKIDWDKACALKLAGWSNSEIAVELHASKGTIDNAIYKHLNEYEQGKREGRREEETEED